MLRMGVCHKPPTQVRDFLLKYTVVGFLRLSLLTVLNLPQLSALSSNSVSSRHFIATATRSASFWAQGLPSPGRLLKIISLAESCMNCRVGAWLISIMSKNQLQMNAIWGNHQGQRSGLKVWTYRQHSNVILSWLRSAVFVIITLSPRPSEYVYQVSG